MSYSDHAPLAPSSAARWMQCGGSRALEALYPEDDISPKAAEGTLAHTVVAARMRGENEPGGTDEDMREAADMFEDEVYAQVPRGTVLKVEYRVKMPSIHPENYGTPDCFSIDPVKRAVHVWDFKYGHRYVDVYRNWQLLDYAWGALTDHGMPTAAELRDWSVRLCIVQPRYFAGPPVRDWSITGYELYEYAGKLAVGAMHAMRDDAPTVANDECLDCKARVPCRALALTAGAIRDYSSQSVPFDLPVEAAAREYAANLKALDRLKARNSGLEAELMGKMKLGTVVPGLMLEQGAGREKWSVPVDEAIGVADLMGVDIRKPGVLTPRQAVKAGLDPSLLMGYTKRDAGTISIVPVTDKTSRVFANPKE